MADQCKWGHDTRKPNSRDRSGYCRLCRKARNKQEYLKVRAAQDVVAIFQAAGAVFMDGDRLVSADELARQLVKVVGPTIKQKEGVLR